MRLVQFAFFIITNLCFLSISSRASMENSTAFVQQSLHPGASRRIFQTPKKQNICPSGTVVDRQGYCRRVFDD